jgi:hypothetical protein
MSVRVEISFQRVLIILSGERLCKWMTIPRRRKCWSIPPLGLHLNLEAPTAEKSVDLETVPGTFELVFRSA